MLKKLSLKKGQGYALELIFFVMLALIIIYTLLSIYLNLIKLNSNENKYYIVTWTNSDILVRTRGFSPDWEEDGNLSILGITNGRNVIDTVKLEGLNSLSNEELARLLHLDIYNVSIEVLVNGNVYFQKGNINSQKTINQIERVCVFINGTPCLLRIRYSLG